MSSGSMSSGSMSRDERGQGEGGREGFGLYGGAGRNGWVWARPESALLVLGPPRSGKTAAVVVPNVLVAPGAVVSTSTKPDVVGATLPGRLRRGRCVIFDPSGRTVPPPGVGLARWSPLSGCQDWEVSLSRAHALARASRPGRGLSEATHWVERAEALLAPLLHAGALGGLGMETVVRWVARREVGEALVVLGSGSLPADTLAGIDRTEERERSGIFSTASSILSPYRSGTALAAAEVGDFDPDAFVASAGTLYICAPARAQDQLAPLVVALIEELVAAAYAHSARVPGGPVVLFALDEVANIAPLPGLPALVAEGASQGARTLACLQDLSQARARWGGAAEGFLSLFGAKLVLPGIGDHATLSLLSALCGDRDVVVRSENRARWPLLGRGPWPSVATSTVRRPRLAVAEVARGRPGAGLWLVGGEAPAFVRLTPWYAVSPWAELARGEVPAAGARPSPAGRSSWWRCAGWLGAGWLGAGAMGWPAGNEARHGGRWRRWWGWGLFLVGFLVLPAAWWSVGVLGLGLVLLLGPALVRARPGLGRRVASRLLSGCRREAGP
ncbi:MAG: type IV secretory system conjugative DNA transfer family protein [Acidimicrobiales bacterium]